MTITEAFDNFIFSRQLADLSPKTIADYTMFVTPFVTYIGANKDFHTITQEDINKYMMSVLKRPLAKSTKATYIRHVKIFLRWCENEYTAVYRAKQITVPKSPKKNVKIYSDEDVQEIFKNIRYDIPWITYRNKCIVALMYDSGLRQNEVCCLLRANISLKQGMITVHGKGDKERTVPLGKLTQHFMKLYIDACPYESERLFVNKHGEPLSCNAVKLFMHKLADLLPFEISSHKLRHNFATNYCIDQYGKHGNIDIYSLMYLMGHTSIETTKRYLHFAMEIVASRNAISHLDNIFTGEN